jgi:hypothetical protein
MREQWPRILLAAVVAQIPFEVRYTLLGLSNLQWAFVALVLVSASLLFNNRQQLLTDPLVQAAALFVGTQWLAVLYAPEFQTNALKGAIRFTAGFLLLTIVRSLRNYGSLSRIWVISSVAAAAYSLAAYAGFGLPWLFRTEEFYIGQIQRLSGSFEYPNTAAAYCAMSLPIIWWSEYRPTLRTIFACLLWCTVVLTFSKGALMAVSVVPLATGWNKAVSFLAIGVASYALLLPLNPYLLERIHGPSMRNPTLAEYTTPWNELQQQPEATDEVPVQIRNSGITTWRSEGWRRVAVSYRWYNLDTESFVNTIPIVTALPHDVKREETVEIHARFQTPDWPGHYILAVELFTGDFDWFSRMGVVPTLIQADVQTGVWRSVGIADLSSVYNRGETAGSLTASVPRSSLWSAAWKMFAAHPFGVGPDNYRLEYGKYLGATRWDTHVYSNNLYLEILTGSGILGLAAFGLMLIVTRWRPEPACLAAGVFLVHGLADVFIMSTPIYFTFWIMLGSTPRRGSMKGQIVASPLLSQAPTENHVPRSTFSLIFSTNIPR